MIHKPALWLLPMILLAAACSRTPDETLIRQQLDSLQTAVQQRQPKEVMAHLTEDFLAQGRMGTKEVRRFLLAQFFRNKEISVLVTGLKIRVDTGTGTAEVSFRAAAAGGENWLPERADYYQINSSWQKDDGDWLIRRLDWKPVLAG